MTVRKWQKSRSAVHYKCQITGLCVKKCVVPRKLAALMSGASAFIGFLESSKVFSHSLSNIQYKTVRHMSDQYQSFAGPDTPVPSWMLHNLKCVPWEKLPCCWKSVPECTLANDSIYCEDWRVQGRGITTILHCVWTRDAVTVSAGWTMQRMLTKFWCARTCV